MASYLDPPTPDYLQMKTPHSLLSVSTLHATYEYPMMSCGYPNHHHPAFFSCCIHQTGIRAFHNSREYQTLEFTWAAYTSDTMGSREQESPT